MRLRLGLAALVVAGAASCASDSALPSDGAATSVAEMTTTLASPSTSTSISTVDSTVSVPSTVEDVITIHPDGFGDAMLNDDPEATIAYFVGLFGPPIADSGWVTGDAIALCDTDAFRAVSWANLYTVYAERDALGGGRCETRHFVHFSYGMKDGVLPADPYATDEGLVPGDSVERLVEMYPDVVVYDGSLGGRFYRTSEDRNLGPNGVVLGAPEFVASIDAGDWPCQDTD